MNNKKENFNFQYQKEIAIVASPYYRKIYENFGVVTSFTGTYKADKWSLNLRSSNGT